MNACSSDLDAEIIKFLSEELRVEAAKIFYSTSINNDLGVDGDDAVELLEKFGQRFHVEIDESSLEKYFGVEGALTPLGVMKWLFGKGERLSPLTVSNLIDAAKTGKI